VKQSLHHGTLSPDGNATVGNTTIATCTDGYRIAGSYDNAIVSAVLTCGINGTWNRTVECEPKGNVFGKGWFEIIATWMFPVVFTQMFVALQ